MKRKQHRAKLTQEEYNSVKKAVDKNITAYKLYEAQKELGSKRSYSFWARWVKRVQAGQTFEEYGKANFIPETTSSKAYQPRPRRTVERAVVIPNDDYQPKEGLNDMTNEPTSDVQKDSFGIDLQKYSEDGILKVQEAINTLASIQVDEKIGAIIRNTTAETEIDMAKSRLEDAQKAHNESLSVNRELRRENRELRREVSDLKDELRQIERDTVGDKRAVDVVQGYMDNIREIVADVLQEEIRRLAPSIRESMRAGDIITK